MQNPFEKIIRRACLTAVLFLALVGADFSRAQMIDFNGNGISDIWEWLYNASSLNPSADADGDGFSNLQEALAGTNPFDSNSYPRISLVFSSATNFSVTMPCALGKQYTLQSIPTLGSTNWFVETNLVARTGTNVTLAVPMTTTMKFYRVAISDTNSDGTGLMNDWEKYQLGLDPFNPASNGQQDAFGNAISDYTFVTNQLASQNVVTIVATRRRRRSPTSAKPRRAPGSSPSRAAGFALGAITVNLGLGGPGIAVATAGLDFSNPQPRSLWRRASARQP